MDTIQLSNFSRICIIKQKGMFTYSLIDYLENKLKTPCSCGNKIDSLNLKSSDLLLIEAYQRGYSDLLNLLNQVQIESPCISVCLFNMEESELLTEYLSYPIVKGIFNLNQSQDMIFQGIINIDKGSYWFSRKHLDYLANMREKTIPSINIETSFDISNREKQILNALILGQSNKAIAKKLSLSVHTINTHRNNLYRKLGVNCRKDAIKLALNNHE